MGVEDHHQPDPFAVDVTVCSKCGGRMKILEVVTEPAAIAALLHGARAPPRVCPPGQLWMFAKRALTRRGRLRASSRRPRVAKPGKGGELAYERTSRAC